MPIALDPQPYPLDHLTQYGADGDDALVLRAETLSWQDLRTRVAQLGAWLARHVTEPGARVASWAAKGELTCLLPLAAPGMRALTAAGRQPDDTLVKMPARRSSRFTRRSVSRALLRSSRVSSSRCSLSRPM